MPITDDTPFKIEVLRASGEPAPGVEVVCIRPFYPAVLADRTIKGGDERQHTDSKGRFLLSPPFTGLMLVIATDKDFSMAFGQDLVGGQKMVMQPWADVEGVWKNQGRPQSGRLIRLVCRNREFRELFQIRAESVSNLDGRFVFKNAPPTAVLLEDRLTHPAGVWHTLKRLTPEPGSRDFVEIATRGRTVIGQLSPVSALKVDFADCDGWLRPDVEWWKERKIPAPPKELNTPSKREKWRYEYYQTNDGREYLDARDKVRPLEIQANGSFIAELVAPGQYTLEGKLAENGEVVAALEKMSFTVPDEDREPLPIGKVDLCPAI